MGTLENLYRSSRNHDQLMSSILMETIVYKTSPLSLSNPNILWLILTNIPSYTGAAGVRTRIEVNFVHNKFHCHNMNTYIKKYIHNKNGTCYLQ